MATDHTTSDEEAGQQVVSRRAVLGATIGGIGAATAVGLGTAAMWPDSTSSTTVAAASGGSSGETIDDGSTAAIDFAAEPGEDFEARDSRLPAAPAETEHTIELRATELPGEVAPGVPQQLWTFEDLVPAPFYRGKLGDRFVFTLKNEGTLDHSVDFHASKVRCDGPRRAIPPGESR